jgi:hypothetical protein
LNEADGMIFQTETTRIPEQNYLMKIKLAVEYVLTELRMVYQLDIPAIQTALR